MTATAPNAVRQPGNWLFLVQALPVPWPAGLLLHGNGNQHTADRDCPAPGWGKQRGAS